jgi:WD40 repeat protein
MFDRVWLAASEHGAAEIKLTKGAHWSAANLPTAHTEGSAHLSLVTFERVLTTLGPGVHSVDSWGWMLASGSADTKIAVFDRNSRRLMYKLEGHSGAVKCVKINRFSSAEESSLFPAIGSCSVDKSVRIWRTSTDHQANKLTEHSLVSTLRGHTDKCMSMDWMAANRVVSGGFVR